jgi:hypothetical protein
MAVTTYEGVVEKGQIRLKAGVQLPENTKVYVIVPDVKIEKKKIVQILTPRLAHREDASRFKLTVTEEKLDA